MSTSSPTPRGGRVDVRIAADSKALIARSASYAGVSISSFLVKAGAGQARGLITEHANLSLSPRDWDVFVATLDSAERRRPKLAVAARRYARRRDGR